MAPLAFNISSRALVVSSARAGDHAKVRAEKAHAAHKRAIVPAVCWLPRIKSPHHAFEHGGIGEIILSHKRWFASQTPGEKQRLHDVAKPQLHGTASGSVSQPEQDARDFNCRLLNPRLPKKMSALPRTDTSRSLEAHGDPKPDSSP